MKVLFGNIVVIDLFLLKIRKLSGLTGEWEGSEG